MKHPLRLWIWAAVVALSSVGALRLRFDAEVLNLLPSHSRAVQGLKLYQQNFSDARELIVTLQAPTAELAESAARVLAQSLRPRTNLAAEVTWQQPWLEYPAEVAEWVGYLWFNQPPEIFGTLTNRLLGADAAQRLVATRDELSTSLSPPDIARLSHDPFDLLQPPTFSGTGTSFDQTQEIFSSPSGNFRLLFVRAARELRGYRECRKWLTAVAGVIEAARKAKQIPSEIQIQYTGRPVFVSEIAAGMERDINGSIAGTLAVIALLFFWAHRTWRPLLWLIALLILLLAMTLALGGLVIGTLNVVSAGFAAVLLGLAVDYALVVYQEHRAAPDEPPNRIRNLVAPSILWSALTTAGAFAILNVGGVPGLGQLGSLVAIGIVLAAVVMLNFYLPPLVAVARKANESRAVPPNVATRRPLILPPAGAWALTVILVAAATALVSWRHPVLDRSPDPLRPRRSAAYAALDEIRIRMGHKKEPLWIIISGDDERQVSDRLSRVLPILREARASGAVESYMLPVSLWPNAGFQAANRPIALELAQSRDHVRDLAFRHGFTADALSPTDALLRTWARAAQASGVFWPSNHLSQWILAKFTARAGNELLALGMVYPAAESARLRSGSSEASEDWMSALDGPGVWLSGWRLMGQAVLEIVERDLWRVLLPIAALLLVSLWLAFGRIQEMLLSVATLALSALSLLAVMALAGWSWNLLNMMALPLLLGAGVDYSIHMQLGLRRHAGEIPQTRQIIGRALLLCAATTVTGFGSLVWSSNAGLRSLGQVCATGVGLTFLISVFLLPHWWKELAGFIPCEAATPRSLQRPSSLYSSTLWRAGYLVVRNVPARLVDPFAQVAGRLYWLCHPRRRNVVMDNLVPALSGNRTEARKLSGQLFQQFALKVADLLRYESGLSVNNLVCDLRGWEYFQAAQRHGRGILLLNAHLGNWELGAPLLAARGIALTVITSHEPDTRLTELRKASRSRWGVETLVIGENPFAFVDLIRRLEAGGTVALLVDRPYGATATEVQLFGRRFLASVAPAELARATGCVLLPVYMPRVAGGYGAEVLPEIDYDRAALGRREARAELTQQIMRAFEPAIKQYLAQWYHFVPIWPKNRSAPCPDEARAVGRASYE